MSDRRYETRPALPRTGWLVAGLALAIGLISAWPATAQSSAEDRARFVSITQKLEEAPLRPDSRADREWALAWLVEAPDVSVTVCLSSLGDMEESYPYAGEVALQYMFEMAAQVIEHPDAVNDPAAQQTAGVVGALNAYRAIRAEKPDTNSPNLDALLEIEASGGLPEFIRSHSDTCT